MGGSGCVDPAADEAGSRSDGEGVRGGEAMRVEKEDVQLAQHCMSATGTGDDCGEVDHRREDHGMMCVVFSLSAMVMGGSRLSDGTGVVPLTADDLPGSALENLIWDGIIPVCNRIR